MEKNEKLWNQECCICMTEIWLQKISPCCKNFVCENCLISIEEKSKDDTLSCPFCRKKSFPAKWKFPLKWKHICDSMVEDEQIAKIVIAHYKGNLPKSLEKNLFFKLCSLEKISKLIIYLSLEDSDKLLTNFILSTENIKFYPNSCRNKLQKRSNPVWYYLWLSQPNSLKKSILESLGIYQKINDKIEDRNLTKMEQHNYKISISGPKIVTFIDIDPTHTTVTIIDSDTGKEYNVNLCEYILITRDKIFWDCNMESVDLLVLLWMEFDKINGLSSFDKSKLVLKNTSKSIAGNKFSKHDVLLVMEQAKVEMSQAFQALERSNGDIVDAIMDLTVH